MSDPEPAPMLDRRQIADEAASARGIYAATIMNITADAMSSYTGEDARRWRSEAAEKWDRQHPLLASLIGGISTGDQT